MRVRDLGRLEFGGASTHLPLGRRAEIVLGSLLAVATPVAASTLAERAWPGLAGDRQRANLQTVVSRLRAGLRATESDLDPLPWTPSGYRLTLSADSVDSTLFQTLRRNLDDAADAHERIAITDRALELWQGAFLGDLGREPWAQVRRHELDLARREMLDIRWSTLIGQGRAADVLTEVDRHQVDDLEAAGGENWEHGHGHRMRALLRTGQLSDASAEYAEIERALRDHAGRTPGPVVDRLRADLLRLEATRRASSAPSVLQHASAPRARPEQPIEPERVVDSRTPGRPVTTMPPLVTRMVGREEDVTQLEGLLRDPDVRLISLLGPGGVGKTTLALQLARSAEVGLDYPDGVVWVGLSRARSREQLLTLISVSLNFDPHGADVVHRLAQYIASRRILLILDNLEQLADHAEVLTELLGRCPGLAVLGTSRRALDVRGEVRYWVPTLPVPEPGLRHRVEDVSLSPSVAVLVRRARETAPGFRLSTENAGAVAEICVRLDGLPLALELAASRLDLFSAQDLLARLSTDLGVIAGGARDLPERQRTLRDTLDWSYRLLSPTEQTHFRRLAVFQGGFDYQAAEAVALSHDNPADPAASPAGSEALQSLISQSLLRTIRGPGSVRFALLETVRQFAARQLTAAERATVLDRHLQFYLDLAERLAPQLSGPARREALDQLELERDNLRAALRHGLEQTDPGPALRLVNALGWLWYFRGPLAEGRDWCRQVLDRVDADAVSADRAAALWNAGRLAHLQGATSRATALLETSVSLWRSLPGERNGLAYALSDLGQVRWIAGDRETGRRLAEESVAVFRRTGDRWGLALALQDLGQDVLSSRDLAAAATLYGEVQGIFSQLGDRWGCALPLLGLGRVAIAAGRPEESRQYLEEAHGIFADIGDRRLVAFTLMRLGQLERGVGDTSAATRWYRGALAAWRELDHEVGVAHALAGLSGSAAKAGRMEHATLLAGAAANIMEQQNRQMSPLDSADYAPYLAAAEKSLGVTRFLTTMDRGRRLSRPDILALAADPAPGGAAVGSRHGVGRVSGPAGERAAGMEDTSPVVRPALTDREREIVDLVQQGLGYEQIAAMLFITRRTVGFHLGRVYQKLQVSNRAELISLLRVDRTVLDP